MLSYAKAEEKGGRAENKQAKRAKKTTKEPQKTKNRENHAREKEEREKAAASHCSSMMCPESRMSLVSASQSQQPLVKGLAGLL